MRKLRLGFWPAMYMLIVVAFVWGVAYLIEVGKQPHGIGDHVHPLDFEGCTYWEVARPDHTTGQTWIIGWMKECNGRFEPLVEFGPDQTAEEALLIWEKRLGLSGFTGGDSAE